MVWADLKRHIAKKFCQTEDEATEAVNEFRQTLTPEKCQNYINNLKKVVLLTIKIILIINNINYYNIIKVIDQVIENNGGSSNY